MAGKRHCLIAFDAFGTLFSPRPSVPVQYASVAEKFGIPGLKPSAIGTSFKDAYKHMSHAHPNYGNKTGLTVESWWRQVIEKTFIPHISAHDQDTKLPKLAENLIWRFWSKEGYAVHEDAVGLLEFLRQQRNNRTEEQGQIVIGVLSNSDPRVPDILRDFKLEVTTLRVSQPQPSHAEVSNNPHVQFLALSHDVGHEKPAPEIFRSAEMLARACLESRIEAQDELVKIYVGDEVVKDGKAAVAAGWEAVVVRRDSSASDGKGDVTCLAHETVSSLYPAIPKVITRRLEYIKKSG